MNLTKILAGILVALAIGLAIMAWVIGRQPQRAVVPVTASSSTDSSSETKAAITATAPPAPTYPTVVAARAVAAGQKLEAEDLKLIELPTALADGIPAAEVAVGRTTLTALAVDAPLLEQNLVNGLSLQLEPGQRALSIAVKEPMAAGNHVRPGDFVDVYFTMDGRHGADNATVDTQTRLLLARSRVLAYGSISVEDPPPTMAQRKKAQAEEAAANQSSGQRRSGGSADSGRTQQPANTALLAVPLEDVERLTLAEKYGQLTLALRHPDDLSVPNAALFAALPTALRPVAGRLPKGETLQGVDRAFAGLRFKDLATGADAKNARHSGPPPNASRSSASAPKAPRSQTVQIHQGAAVQTVNY